MRAIAPLQVGLGGASKTSPLPVRAVKKASASSFLRRERQEPDPERGRTRQPLRVELVSRDDAIAFDPFWDAPRLLPAFVAQVLGQAMPEQREPVRLETTYGRAASRTALLLDRKS